MFKYTNMDKLLIRYADFKELYSKLEPSVLYISNFVNISRFEKEETTRYYLDLLFAEFEIAKNKVITIINGEEQELERIMSKSPILSERYFNFKLKIKDFSKETIKYLLMQKLYYAKEISKSFELELEKYINNTYDSSEIKNYEYIDNLYNKIVFNSGENQILESNLLPSIKEDRDIENILKDLNALTGLYEIKKQIQDLIYLLDFNKKIQGSLNINKLNLHMVFMGNPGTGKTTVARLLSEILYTLGYIKRNKSIEVQAKDLIGKYIGQTAPKTYEIIKSALDGVLFIDEAYSIMQQQGENSNFTQDCISVLNKCMEDYKDRLVIIFAGYKNEMKEFLALNPGLVSRIGYNIEFEDYTQEELEEIFVKEFEKGGFIVDEQAKEKARNIIFEARQLENFGNARFIIKFYQDVIINHAKNTHQTNDLNILKTITQDDINSKILESIVTKKNKLGFM